MHDEIDSTCIACSISPAHVSGFPRITWRLGSNIALYFYWHVVNMFAIPFRWHLILFVLWVGIEVSFLVLFGVRRICWLACEGEYAPRESKWPHTGHLHTRGRRQRLRLRVHPQQWTERHLHNLRNDLCSCQSRNEKWKRMCLRAHAAYHTIYGQTACMRMRSLQILTGTCMVRNATFNATQSIRYLNILKF